MSPSGMPGLLVTHISAIPTSLTTATPRSDRDRCAIWACAAFVQQHAEPYALTGTTAATKARRVLGMLASAYSLAGRFARARLSHLAAAGMRSWTAAAIGLMAFIVVLPIPFGNLLPALAIMLIGLGLVFRDGLAVVLGMLTAGLALFVTAGLSWWHGRGAASGSCAGFQFKWTFR